MNPDHPSHRPRSPAGIGRLFIGLLAILCCPPQAAADRALERLKQTSTAVEELAQQVNPAVVEVVVSGYEVSSAGRRSRALTRTRSSGSGVIVDPAGYIVTNAHVVEGGQDIQVLLTPAASLPGQRSVLKAGGPVLPAELIGLDPETDLAVLRIEAGDSPHDYPYLGFGDSEALRPGRLVFAFGSPLGLENSVSMGVVSAVARQLEPDSPMIYIQTDAAINPGNSGGPLVDLEGRMVGINTMIFSQSGGNEGIGFAAPSNIVATVYRRIRAEGRVRRGMIGTAAQTLTPQLAAGLGLPVQRGVILADVFPGGPAAKAGLRVGDLIETLDGKPMENARQFEVNLYLKDIGSTVTVGSVRDGQPSTTRITVVERPDPAMMFAELPDLKRSLIPELGVVAVSLSEEMIDALPPLRGTTGVLVVAESRDATSGESPLRSGDIIYSLNTSRLASVDDIRALIATIDPGAPLVFQVQRQNRLRYLLGTRP
ncbi:MAG: trypsin-like peptidase domain-containing protein [Gammaproteobacteria bacterium]